MWNGKKGEWKKLSTWSTHNTDLFNRSAICNTHKMRRKLMSINLSSLISSRYEKLYNYLCKYIIIDRLRIYRSFHSFLDHSRRNVWAVKEEMEKKEKTFQIFLRLGFLILVALLRWMKYVRTICFTFFMASSSVRRQMCVFFTLSI